MEETDFEIDHFSTFQTSMTMTLDEVIQHTVTYHSLTSTCTPNFIQIEVTFCGRMDGQVMDTEISFIRPSRRNWRQTTVARKKAIPTDTFQKTSFYVVLYSITHCMDQASCCNYVTTVSNLV